MSEDNNKEKEKKKKSKIDNLVEMWKDKRGRAKIKLALYCRYIAKTKMICLATAVKK